MEPRHDRYDEELHATELDLADDFETPLTEPAADDTP